MRPIGGLLVEAILDPRSLATLEESEWDRLLRAGHRAGILGRIAAEVAAAGLDGAVPSRARARLAAADAVARQHERILRWETVCVARALRGVVERFVLLKGGAYLHAGDPSARGRLSSDLDVLVPRASLEAVERALGDAGWEATKLNRYDQKYYRRWMHELPPLRHRDRRTLLDVHHTLLPETGRLHPDPASLLARAEDLPEPEGAAVLCTEDRVLHAATHLFHDGDLGGGLRELLDVDGLVRGRADDHAFWDRVLEHAAHHELERPLFYAVRACRRHLDTPVPEAALARLERGAPRSLTRRSMEALADRALFPDDDRRPGVPVRTARWALYARSHWLRMPLRLLIPHLARKAARRWSTGEGSTA